MKLLPLKLAALATVALTSILPVTPAKAFTFDETQVEQDQFIAVAQPVANRYNLLVIEQVPGKKQCWSETGSNPVSVEPLLLNFDFTGICKRSTDSNGYSIRVDNQDYGLDYILNIVERNGELQLIGSSRNPNQPDVVIGKTNGLKDGFLKIFLNPGWKFSKRTYEGKVLGHVYFSGDSTAMVTPDGSTPIATTPEENTEFATAAFGDITTDIYKAEIENAVNLGFIAGFEEDNTFRPQTSLTREQLVSMVIEAIGTIPNANLTLPNQSSSSPFSDVSTERWSAAKIQWAQENNIVSGYPDGTFKPEQPVTRAELMAVLRKAAEYTNVKLGKTPDDLTEEQATLAFSDTTGHWAASLVTTMSSYCEVASPLNESGNAFYPDTPSLRNYAAAATLRMLNCVKSEPQ